MSIPEWAKGLARNWGAELRRFERDIEGLQGTMGRIHEEGPVGAAIRSYREDIPYHEFTHPVKTFHRAWIDLKPELKAIIWLDFKMPGKTKAKIKKSGLPQATYYRKRAEALNIIVRDFHLYSQNYQEGIE